MLFQDDSQREAVPDPDISSLGDFGTYVTDRFVSYGEGALALVPRLVVVAAILLLVWGIARFLRFVIGFAMRRAGVRPALRDLAKTLLGVAVWIVGGFMAMSVLFPSLDPGGVVAGLGVGGIVLGIAFKDIFQNFMAGVLILLRKTMRIGDYIECNEVQGRIEQITLRDTYLRRVDGELVLVPNGYLFDNPVRVWTDPDHRRYEIVAGVAYDEDVAESRAVIQKALDGLDFGAPRKPQVFAAEFGASSVNFTVRWWAGPEPLDMHESRDRVVQAVKEALDGAGIEIPFPYRTLTFKEPLPIVRDGEGGQNMAAE